MRRTMRIPQFLSCLRNAKRQFSSPMTSSVKAAEAELLNIPEASEASALIAKGNFKAAKPLLLRTLDITERIGSTHELTHAALRSLATVNALDYDTEKALQYFDRVVTVARANGNKYDTMQAIAQAMRGYLYSNKPKNTISLYKQYNDTFQSDLAADLAADLEIRTMASIGFQLTGDDSKALSMMKAAIEQANESSSSGNCVLSNIQKSRLHRNFGAIQYYASVNNTGSKNNTSVDIVESQSAFQRGIDVLQSKTTKGSIHSKLPSATADVRLDGHHRNNNNVSLLMGDIAYTLIDASSDEKSEFVELVTSNKNPVLFEYISEIGSLLNCIGYLQVCALPTLKPGDGDMKRVSETLRKSLKINEVVAVHCHQLSRTLVLLARVYHRMEQAVSSEGLFNSALDASYSSLPGFPVDRLDVAEGSLWLSDLYAMWEKRGIDAKTAKLNGQDILRELNLHNTEAMDIPRLPVLKSLYNIGKLGF